MYMYFNISRDQWFWQETVLQKLCFCSIFDMDRFQTILKVTSNCQFVFSKAKVLENSYQDYFYTYINKNLEVLFTNLIYHTADVHSIRCLWADFTNTLQLHFLISSMRSLHLEARCFAPVQTFLSPLNYKDTQILFFKMLLRTSLAYTIFVQKQKTNH